MRTTVNLDEKLVEEARRITGTKERTALIHDGLRALIERESARRLACAKLIAVRSGESMRPNHLRCDSISAGHGVFARTRYQRNLHVNIQRI